MPEALTQWVLAHPDLTVTLTVLLTLAAVALTVALSVALRGRGAWQTRAHEAENRVAALTSDLGAKQQWLDQAEGERRRRSVRELIANPIWRNKFRLCENFTYTCTTHSE